MKIKHEWRVIHVLCVQVKFSSKVKFLFFERICLSCPVLSQDSTNVICFVGNFKMEFQKSDVNTLNCFLGLCTA